MLCIVQAAVHNEIAQNIIDQAFRDWRPQIAKQPDRLPDLEIGDNTHPFPWDLARSRGTAK